MCAQICSIFNVYSEKDGKTASPTITNFPRMFHSNFQNKRPTIPRNGSQRNILSTTGLHLMPTAYALTELNERSSAMSFMEESKSLINNFYSQ